MQNLLVTWEVIARPDQPTRPQTLRRKRPIELQEVVSSVMTSAAILHGDRNRIRVDLDDSVPSIWGEERLVAHALWNVVDNALRYSYRGKDVQIDLRRVMDRIELTVRNWGLPIENDELRTCLQAYGRSRAAQQAGPGSGLGLFVAQQIIRAGGGDLVLRCVENLTVVRLVFPVASKDRQ